MVALRGREFVNLPLLCGIAEHSHDASDPATRGAFSSFYTAGVSSFSLGWLTDCQRPSVLLYLSPFFNPQLGQLPPPPPPLLLLLPFPAVWSRPSPSPFLSICVVNAPGPSVRASRCHDPSSLCAPRSERSDPVSIDGVLQEPGNLLTVLLRSTQHMTNIKTHS